MLANASPSLMDASISYSCSRFVTNEQADEVEAFFQTHELESSKRRISQLVENMRTNGSLLMKIKNSKLAEANFWK